MNKKCIIKVSVSLNNITCYLSTIHFCTIIVQLSAGNKNIIFKKKKKNDYLLCLNFRTNLRTHYGFIKCYIFIVMWKSASKLLYGPSIDRKSNAEDT